MPQMMSGKSHCNFNNPPSQKDKDFVASLLYVRPIDYERSARLERLIHENEKLRDALIAEQIRRVRMLELYVDMREYCNELELYIVRE